MKRSANVQLQYDSLHALFEDSYLPQEIPNTTASHVYKWKGALNKFEAAIGRSATITDLNLEMLSGAVTKLSGRYSSQSLEDMVRRLFALWRHLADGGQLQPPPSPLPKLTQSRWTKRPVPLWTPDELALLWYSCRRTRGFIGDVKANDWWLGLVSIVWETKQHPSEFLGRLTWEELPLDRLHPATVAALAKIRREGQRIVLQEFPSQTELWTRYARILRAVGLPDDKAHSFRCLIRCSRDYPRFFHPSDLPTPTELKGAKPCLPS